MTQNFPLHAFDHLGRFKHRGGVTPMPSPLLFKGEDVSDSIEVSIPRGDAAPTVTFCDCLVGLNLGIDPPYDYSRKEPEDFDPTGAGVLGKFMEDLVDTIVHPGGAGQVRTYEEDLATIWLNTYRPDSDHPGDALSTYDFSTPSICRSRRDEHKARLIEDLVRLAEETVLKSFQG